MGKSTWLVRIMPLGQLMGTVGDSTSPETLNHIPTAGCYGNVPLISVAFNKNISRAE